MAKHRHLHQRQPTAPIARVDDNDMHSYGNYNYCISGVDKYTYHMH